MEPNSLTCFISLLDDEPFVEFSLVPLDSKLDLTEIPGLSDWLHQTCSNHIKKLLSPPNKFMIFQHHTEDDFQETDHQSPVIESREPVLNSNLPSTPKEVSERAATSPTILTTNVKEKNQNFLNSGQIIQRKVKSRTERGINFKFLSYKYVGNSKMNCWITYIYKSNSLFSSINLKLLLFRITRTWNHFKSIRIC